MWIIVRTKGDYTELFMDLNRIDRVGEWRAYDQGLPLQFDKRFRAWHEMYKQMEKDPDWEYEVREYNR